MFCRKHKKYKGVRIPASHCLPCWKIYLETHKDISIPAKTVLGLVEQYLDYCGLSKFASRREEIEYNKKEKEAYQKIYDHLDRYLPSHLKIEFVAFEQTPEGLPFCNLKARAAHGNIILVRQHYGSNDYEYESGVIKNPTWRKIALLADEMVRFTADNHSIYLEGIRKIESGDPAIYEFCMGS